MYQNDKSIRRNEIEEQYKKEAHFPHRVKVEVDILV